MRKASPQTWMSDESPEPHAKLRVAPVFRRLPWHMVWHLSLRSLLALLKHLCGLADLPRAAKDSVLRLPLFPLTSGERVSLQALQPYLLPGGLPAACVNQPPSQPLVQGGRSAPGRHSPKCYRTPLKHCPLVTAPSVGERLRWFSNVGPHSPATCTQTVGWKQTY